VIFAKEDGRKLVGQCEISHPMQQESEPADIIISDPFSPGMGEVISQRENVMFEQESKGEYEALGSPISRRFQGGFRGSVNVIGVSHHLKFRVVLHQCVWYRDSSFSKSGLSFIPCFERCLGIFLWFPLDQVIFCVCMATYTRTY
jgi:hypothetical protein